ncbi:hypothetical protein [Lysobacter sp. Hz 25]|uniref:hypothetical protein n=1 Tax=Lysobacter sp. Hz 25 TaxID=3383698 RepID=UPI0038D42CEF
MEIRVDEPEGIFLTGRYVDRSAIVGNHLEAVAGFPFTLLYDPCLPAREVTCLDLHQ